MTAVISTRDISSHILTPVIQRFDAIDMFYESHPFRKVDDISIFNVWRVVSAGGLISTPTKKEHHDPIANTQQAPNQSFIFRSDNITQGSMDFKKRFVFGRLYKEEYVDRNNVIKILVEPDISDLYTEKFYALVENWKKESLFLSSTTSMISLPSYKKIIEMGRVSVKLILKQIEKEGDEPCMWFPALKIITGEDPVPDIDRGNMRAMAAAWLKWGRTNHEF